MAIKVDRSDMNKKTRMLCRECALPFGLMFSDNMTFSLEIPCEVCGDLDTSEDWIKAPSMRDAELSHICEARANYVVQTQIERAGGCVDWL